jgi:Fe-S-cluster containining protein
MTDPLAQAGQPPRAGEASTPADADGGQMRPRCPSGPGGSRAEADGDHQLARAVAMCAADAGFLAGLQRLLRQADRAAREHRFKCRQCGECCRFAQFGHRLYVTAGELALMLKLAPDLAPEPIGKIRSRRAGAQSLGDRSAIRNGSRAKPASLCPHQDQARCLARAGRALGCRLFFCDPAANEWFCDAYEGFHQRIKLLHAAHGLPYVYAELTAALAELASAAG